MTKLAWVLLPLVLYAAVLAGALLRGRFPSRHALNIQLSLFLIAYLLGTAGLGIFWVASQQLPVFDWHYLFGYATLLLVALHLWFNVPLVWRWLRGAPHGVAPVRMVGMLPTVLLLMVALVAAFFFGTRQRAGIAAPPSTAAPADAAVAALIRYHEFSSESQRDVFQRAPAVGWGDKPPDFKRYPGAPHVALTRGGVGQTGLSEALRAAQPRAHGLQLAELGDLLFLASGVTARRGGNALRAAPSSGALFSSELYVLARSVAGLPAGVYHYDPDLGRLDMLGNLPAVSGTPASDDAAASIVATSVFRRTGYKYHNRAYRYVVADTGHLLENLRAAGQSAGMQAQLVARFDETQLARTLGIDGIEEGVLAVMDLRLGGAGQRAAGDARFVTPGAADSSPIGVTGAVHRATSLRLASAAGAGDLVALPAAQPADAEVWRVITGRRSQRRFRDEPVPLAALASILADMVQPPQLSDAIRINLVVNRVAGLAPGVYRYLPQHALVRVRSGDFAAASQSAALAQDVIGEAAVVLVLSAERGPMLAEGARGYRHGFLEAGLIGERWLLGAVARGLGACPVGAFYDDQAAALIGVDMRREWVLHFGALGLPAKD